MKLVKLVDGTAVVEEIPDDYKPDWRDPNMPVLRRLNIRGEYVNAYVTPEVAEGFSVQRLKAVLALSRSVTEAWDK
jgi:hypothetical protein